MKESFTETIENKHKSPGFHYICFNSDSIIENVIHGVQNLENNLEVNDSTSFQVFSATKTFTAVSIMQLVQANKIQLNDTIQQHLPAYKFSKPITIQQLLNHQSGLANPIPLKWTHLKDEHSHFDYTEFTDTILLKHLKLKKTPGKKYSYSNLNYLVLGKLIEKVSNVSYEEYVSKNILNQLNTNEFIGFKHPDTNHAIGHHPNTFFQNILLNMLLEKNKISYKVSKDWTAFYPFYVSGKAYGGLYATPKALMSYCQTILNNKLLDRTTTNTMLTEQENNSGNKTGMSLGWFKGELNDNTYYCHAGGGGGYYVEIRIYPDQNFGSVIMTNASGMTDKRLLNHLDNLNLNSNE